MRLFPTLSLRPGSAVRRAALVLAAGAALAAPSLAQETEPRRYAFEAQAPGDAPMSFADLIESVSPAVVSIRVVSTVEGGPMGFRGPPGLEEFFERFGEELPDFGERRRFGEGSGFFISEDGLVVTNNHVVEGADDITVVLAGGEELSAELVGADAPTDLAVLRVEGEGPFDYVSLDPDPDFRVGDWVVAVGNPFGLGGTATAGIISAIGRPIGGQNYTDFIQIDAPINRGNSGGPTFDLNGDVVGVNSAIFSPTGGNVGIGFAIPSDLAASVVDQIINEGGVSRGWLGVGIQPVTEELAMASGLEAGQGGAIIAQIFDDTPAADAGLEQGDIILEVNGAPIEDARDLTRRIGAFPPGERIALRILRDDDERTVRVELGQRPGDGAVDVPEPQNEPEARFFGMSLESANETARRRFEIEGERGVLVTAVRRGSPAAEQGIRPGDVILEAGGEDVASPGDFGEAVTRAEDAGRDALMVLVMSQGGVRYVGLAFEASEDVRSSGQSN